MRKWLLALILFPVVATAQDRLEGRILDGASNSGEGLFGANVVWLNTDIGAVTDVDGSFSIPYDSSYSQLVISYVGYETETITVSGNQRIEHTLQASNDLDEVTVSARKKASARSFLKAENTILVSSDELLKAACCNLSESFETNPSIDVNFANAVSGTRQIRMLGLESPNILIATENIPSIRGAAQAYGLSFIPGTWVESIQITKGAGSVVNGFESIAGQINAELQKPTKDFSFYQNLYTANSGRNELNTHLNTKVSDKWDAGFYLHGNLRDGHHDRNDDNFLDMPTGKQINLMNRWQYTNPEKGLVSFINFRYMDDLNESGQIHSNSDDGDTGGHGHGGSDSNSLLWRSEIETQRFDVSAKLGWVNPSVPYQSLGVQTAFSWHNQDSYFGLNEYDITHASFYGNALYNTIISDSRHKVKAGVSFTYDQYDEDVNETTYERTENSVGGFFEYSYDNLDALTLQAGIRVDNHNRLGFFVTPRLHVKYTPWEKSAFRLSAGSGRRSANIFTENQKLFASNRNINILDTDGKIYGLDPEVAWNYGFSYLQGFNLLGRKADVTFDFYRTDFQNQVVVDWENPQNVRFYNLRGESFANSFQVEFNYTPFERFDLRTAYKYYDIQTDYLSGRLERPLTPKNRVFANAGYETAKSEQGAQWKFDATFNWLDSQRYPSTATSPEFFQLSERTPTVSTLNAQVTKVFSPRFEVYLGGENITDVRQDQPIVNAENPFATYFDTTFVYGPIFGSMYYAGLRYKIQ
ncbi:TonB-dependent receptor [Aureisphaera galaxeae]|uniref:TonB-dependent receptor n=1 Tax=Aureisphaera galaxeae TaxID=1538023 RepID=UPI0023509181|nr:TonB-dependent receptor [Aureisphaera galaxeae]MDC8003058.1 TonB-dependent receptor [Aureisphaera galaxeae]